MNRKSIKKGFTIAELLIVLTVLGIVAVIVTPTLFTGENEKTQKTQMKKAIATYSKIVEEMRVTEDLHASLGEKQDGKRTLNGYANSDGKCTNARKYFKVSKEDTVNNNPCHFMTADGIWWDVTTMSQPIVAFDKKGKPTYLTSDYANATDNELAFYMDTTVKQGSFVVNEDVNTSYKMMEYLGMVNYAGMTTLTKLSSGAFDKECTGGVYKACSEKYSYNWGDGYYENYQSIYDQYGNYVGSKYTYGRENDYSYSYSSYYDRDKDGKTKAYYGDCDENFKNCYYKETYDDNGNYSGYCYGCYNGDECDYCYNW